MATSAPSRASRSATARPMPREPPVTKATRSRMRPSSDTPREVGRARWVLSPGKPDYAQAAATRQAVEYETFTVACGRARGASLTLCRQPPLSRSTLLNRSPKLVWFQTHKNLGNFATRSSPTLWTCTGCRWHDQNSTLGTQGVSETARIRQDRHGDQGPRHARPTTRWRLDRRSVAGAPDRCRFFQPDDDADNSRRRVARAHVAIEMLETGDWVVPRSKGGSSPTGPLWAIG